MVGRRSRRQQQATAGQQAASSPWVFDAESALSPEEKDARSKRQARREAKAQAKGREFNPDDLSTYHRNYRLLQGVPTREGIPPISLPPEVCHFIAAHIWGEDRLNCSDPRDPQIVHVDSPAGPNIAMNAGAWVKPSDVPEVVAEPVPVPDFTSLPPEALAAIEAGLQQAKVTALKVAGADPDARVEAEQVVAARDVASPVPGVEVVE